jgi:hypothetical protein
MFGIRQLDQKLSSSKRTLFAHTKEVIPFPQNKLATMGDDLVEDPYHDLPVIARRSRSIPAHYKMLR